MLLDLVWSPPVFLPLSVADSVQEPYPPLYGVRISRRGGGGSTHTLNKVESKAIRLTDFPPLIDCLQSHTLRHNVASLAIFYRYFHANCSSELANYMPSPLPWPRLTRFFTRSHPYFVHLPYATVNYYLHSCFPSTGKL